MTADADRQRARRRQADRDFLALLPLLSADVLSIMLLMPAPRWRRVAVGRALARVQR